MFSRSSPYCDIDITDTEYLYILLKYLLKYLMSFIIHIVIVLGRLL